MWAKPQKGSHLCCSSSIKYYMVLDAVLLSYPRKTNDFGGILESACLSVRPSACPSVYPSVYKILVSVKALARLLSHV